MHTQWHYKEAACQWHSTFANLDKVLKRLLDVGVCLKRKKWMFQAPTVTYLAVTAIAEGLYPLKDKIIAIKRGHLS